MADPREEFSEKVLAKLKEMNKAVDLTEETVVEQPVVEEPVVEVASIEPDNSFVAMSPFGDQGGGGGAVPNREGNKDILIIPGYGGTSAQTTSQINFYWDYGFGTTGYSTFSATTGLPNTNIDTGKRTSIFNYADNTTNPALVIGGYNGSSWYGPSTTYGTVLNGSVAPIWIHPFMGQIDTNYIYLNPGVSTSTIQGLMSYSNNRIVIGDGSNSKVVAYTTDVAAANQIVATIDTTDTDLYPLFVNLPGDNVTSQNVKTGSTTVSFLLNATNGNMTVGGDIIVLGGEIFTNQTTGNLFTTTATTVNIASAATTLSLGAATGTATIANQTVTLSNATTLNVNGANPTLAASSTGKLTLFNTNITAVDAFQVSTNTVLGATTGTTAIQNARIAFPNVTQITASTLGLTLLAEPITLTAFGGAVTSTILASGTNNTIGANTGTTAILNARVAFPNVTQITGNTAAFNLFNESTNVTAFGAASVLNLGVNSGTSSVLNTTINFPNATLMNMNGANPTIASTATGKLTLFNANITAVDEFQAATNIVTGATTGTSAIRNATIAFPNATNVTGNPGGTLAFLNEPYIVTAFGSSTNLLLGASAAGTTFIRNSQVAFQNASTITGNAGTMSIFNDPTTVTAFTAGTNVTIGATTGTSAFRNATIAFPNVTTMTANAAGLTMFAEPVVLTAFGGAITSVILASSTNNTIGATTGTTAIRNLNIAFPNASTITGNAGTMTIFGDPTSVTAFGSAATLNLGPNTGTATINNTTVTFANAVLFNINGANPTVASSSTGKLTLFNTNITAVDAFGASINNVIGATTGTTAIRNARIAFPNATAITGNAGTMTLFGDLTTVTEFGAVTNGTIFGSGATATFNIATGGVSDGAVKTLNIGTGGTATSTTNITFGGSLNTANNTISFNLNRLQNVQDPTAPQDAATRNYVDNAVQGLDVHESVQAISTTSIPNILYYQQFGASSSAAFVIGTSYFEALNNGALANGALFDGVTLTAGTVTTGSRVLVALGGNTVNYNIGGATSTPLGGVNVINGVYVLTNAGSAGSKWRFDRANDLNDNVELEGGTFVWVQQGATYGDSGWLCTNDTTPTPLSIGGDAITFTQFTGAGQITAGNGLTKSGNTLDVGGTANRITVGADTVDIASNYAGQTSISIVGTVLTGLWRGTAVELAYGGTNQTTWNASNGIVYFNSSASQLALVTNGASSTVLIGGNTGAPSYGRVDLATHVTGILPLVNGGLSTTSFTSNGVLYGNGSASILATGASAAIGAILQTTTSGGAPTFSNTLAGTYSFSNTTEASATGTAAVTFTKGIGVGSTSYITDLNMTGTYLNISGANPTFSAVGGSGTLSLFNSVLQTVNAFGAGTNINIGATTGTTAIQNARIAFQNVTQVTGLPASTLTFFGEPYVVTAFGSSTNLVMGAAAAGTTFIRNTNIAFQNASTITGNSGTMGIFNDPTTVTTFTAGTNITIGATTGTTAIRNATLAFPSVTSITASAAGLTMFAEPVVLTAFGGATTSTVLASSTNNTIGATTGTTAIRNATLAFPSVTSITASTAGLTMFAEPVVLTAFGGAITSTVLASSTNNTIGATTGTTAIRNATIAFPNASTITGNAGTMTIFGDPTSVTAFGAAATLNLGASTGTATIANQTVTLSNATTLNINGANPTVASSSTGKLTLFNTNITAVDAFGVSTNNVIGATSGTTFIRNANINFSNASTFDIGSAVTGSSTYNFGTGAVTAAVKTINLGTGSGAAGTTIVNIGATLGNDSIFINGTTVIAPVLGIPSGGTGVGGFTATDKTLVYWDSTNRLVNLTSAGTSGQALISGGAGAAPSFGTLGVAGGGTGNTTYSLNGILFSPTTTSITNNTNFTFIAGTTTGTGALAAHYINAASLTTGTAVNINVASGSTGKMLVGQLNGADKFSVDFNGNLRATTKSFDIEHPTKPGKRLVYGVLEGPEHGVYHRGTVEGKGAITIALPEYWSLLVGDNYSIQLTPWGNYSVHIIGKTENDFTIKLTGDIISQKFKNIKVDYIVHGSRLDAPLEIEQD